MKDKNIRVIADQTDNSNSFFNWKFYDKSW